MLRFSRIYKNFEAVELDIFAFLGAYFLIILLVQGLLALIPAYFANERGRSFGAFWALGFFATAPIALLAVIAVPHLSEEDRLRRESEFDAGPNPIALKCPACAEYVKSEAKVCKHCGSDVYLSFEKELKARAIIAEEQEKQDRLNSERLEAERKLAQAALEESRKSRKASVVTFLRRPLGKASLIGATFLVLIVSGVVVIRTVPDVTAAYCNQFTGGEDARMSVDYGPVSRAGSEVFDCLTSNLIGYYDLRPSSGLEVSGFRFKYLGGMWLGGKYFGAGYWGIYRP